MDLDLLLTLAIVLVAGVYLWRRFTRKSGGCGCSCSSGCSGDAPRGLVGTSPCSPRSGDPSAGDTNGSAPGR
ncbi:MAG: FeoB-associated Cys-rich membrane protein [Desulfobulbus sp.]|jgi:hypothetical protein